MKFLNKLKHLLNKMFNNKTKLKNILNDVNEGDIIWAKRYENRKIKKEIPYGHREGPMVVLEKCDKGLICSSGTSTYHEEFANKYFELNNAGYNLSKKTFFKLRQLRIIDNKKFIKKIDTLSEEDLKSLLRKLKLSRENYYELNGEIYKIFICIEPGDIINKRINYLVIDVIEDNLLCIPMDKTTKYLKHNLQFDDFRNLDYSKIVTIKNSQDINFVNRASNNALLYVLKEQKEYINNLKNKTTPQRGSVIIKGEKHYYIYGEEGEEWFVFEINKTMTQEYQHILTINKQKFYTNYKEHKINKKEDFKTILLANELEIDSIKKSKKSYNKMKKEGYKKGNIIEPSAYKDKRFIIIGLNDKTYECLSLNKLKEGIYDLVFIKKEDAILSMDQTFNGIIWLDKHPNFNMSKINSSIIDKIVKTQKKYLGINEEQEIIKKETKEVKEPKKQNTIIINGEEYIIKERIENMIRCISIYDKGTHQRQMKYFNINDIKNMEEENKKSL
ncbi:MAG: hypothetical protein IKL65_01165 [Bacilli bacterium]|nr:hypothetical protein [Bacilli bacterium]